VSVSSRYISILVVLGLILAIVLQVNSQKTVAVVVAKGDIEAFETIKADQVTTVRLNRDARHEYAFSDQAKVIGRTTLVPLVAGEQILEPKLAENDGGYLSILGQYDRAVYLPLNRDAPLGSILKPGAYVDLIYVADKRDFSTDSVVVLERVMVIDVVYERSQTFKSGENILGVLLRVSKEEAELLAYLQERGKIYLSLQGAKA